MFLVQDLDELRTVQATVQNEIGKGLLVGVVFFVVLFWWFFLVGWFWYKLLLVSIIYYEVFPYYTGKCVSPQLAHASSLQSLEKGLKSFSPALLFQPRAGAQKAHFSPYWKRFLPNK